jgi:hypothetical protein
VRLRTEPLRSLSIILFWVPLAATWLMMAAEGPYIAGIVARMPVAAPNLAAYGVAVSLAWLIESPIMMLLSAATALVRDRASYLALRRFATMLNVIVTLGMVVLAIPPVFRFVGETLIHLPPEIAHLAHAATLILIPWPAAIGYRRFYQGVLVSHHFTRRVAYGTVVRLVSMSVTAGVLALTTSLPGAILGAIALVAGVTLEAAATRWMARHVVRSLEESGVVAEGTLLELGEILRFYSPLALTSMLSMALGPLVTFGLGRGRAPLQSLAVWPVIVSTVFLFRSGGVAYQEVGIALKGDLKVRATGLWLGLLHAPRGSLAPTDLRTLRGPGRIRELAGARARSPAAARIPPLHPAHKLDPRTPYGRDHHGHRHRDRRPRADAVDHDRPAGHGRRRGRSDRADRGTPRRKRVSRSDGKPCTGSFRGSLETWVARYARTWEGPHSPTGPRASCPRFRSPRRPRRAAKRRYASRAIAGIERVYCPGRGPLHLAPPFAQPWCLSS